MLWYTRMKELGHVVKRQVSGVRFTRQVRGIFPIYLYTKTSSEQLREQHPRKLLITESLYTTVW